MGRSDIELTSDVEDALRWEPMVNFASIGVGVDYGVVSLTGAVNTFAEKLAAEAAVMRVVGVRMLVQRLMVKTVGPLTKTDAEICEAARRALGWDKRVPLTVSVRVDRGKLPLEGEVRAAFQRDAAIRAVRYLIGVDDVYDDITVMADAALD